MESGLDRERRLPGNAAGRRRPPAAADDILEERDDGIEGPARAASGQDEVGPGRTDDDLLRGQGPGR